MPIYEPGLKELVAKNLQEGRLAFIDKLAEAVEISQVIFICVGTPSLPGGKADLSQVEKVSRDLAKNMKGYKVIVNKSTVPVGTGGLVKKLFQPTLLNRWILMLFLFPSFCGKVALSKMPCTRTGWPKDTKALVHTAMDAGYDFKLLQAVIEVNQNQPSRVIEKLLQAAPDLQGNTVALLGLAFKPNTDDLQEAPALAIAGALQQQGARVKAYDPAAMSGARKILPGVECCPCPYSAMRESHAVLFLTE